MGVLRLHGCVHLWAQPGGVVNMSAPLIEPTASGSLLVHGCWSMFPLIFTAGERLGQMPSLSQLNSLGIGRVSRSGQVMASSSQETARSAQESAPHNRQGAEGPHQGDQLSLVRSITSPAMSHCVQPSMERSTHQQATITAGSSGNSMVYIGPVSLNAWWIKYWPGNTLTLTSYLQLGDYPSQASYFKRMPE